MDPYRLKVLRELGERGSLAAVARALHVSPSAVSQQLSALQRTFPVPLTERRGRVLVLTPAGAALAAAAVDVAIALDRADRAVHEHLGDADIPVSLAAFHSAALTYFPPLLSRVADLGGPPLSCADADVINTEAPALAADYDLVLAQRLDHTPPWPDHRLTAIPLIREPILVGIPRHHPLADRDTLSASDVADYPWVSVHDGYPLQPVMDLIAASAGRPLALAHRINDLTVAAAVVGAGAALALLPAYTTPLSDNLVLRELADVQTSRSIDVLTRPETLHRTSARRVLQLLNAVVSSSAAAADSAPTQ